MKDESEAKRGAEKAAYGLLILYMHCDDADIRRDCRSLIDRLCDKYGTKENDKAV